MSISDIAFYSKFLIFPLPAICLVYILVTLISTLIPVNKNFLQPSDGISLYLSTNGIHTSFIIPVKSEIFDWTRILENRLFNLDLHGPIYLSFGWGDKAIYLEVREWNQLTLKIGLRTILLPTPALLRVSAYETLPAEKNVKIFISEEQYLQLCLFIYETFDRDENQKVMLVEGAGYFENDNFFQALGKYHAFNTCNSWVNEGLKKIGVRTSLWTGIDKSIFYQVNKLNR